MLRISLTILVFAVCSQASAGEATCRSYTEADGANRALFDGFIYGYVTAKMPAETDGAVNGATLKVKQLTGAYCLQRPADRVSSVIAVYADSIGALGADGREPPASRTANRFNDCLTAEGLRGNYATSGPSFNGGKSVLLLMDRCRVQWDLWQAECIAKGGTDGGSGGCASKAFMLAYAALKLLGR